MADQSWTPTHTDPLFIMAMDHRDSFGSKLYGVQDDSPTPDQLTAMARGKVTIWDGLRAAAAELSTGRAGVLVDEQYGQSVIDRAQADRADPPAGRPPVVLAVPIEASGHEWFTLQWGGDWLDHLRTIRPDYAKVLVRDNPGLDPAKRSDQLSALARVSTGLHDAGIPLLYELLVPATDEQLNKVDGDSDRYDAELRPDLVTRVIADNQDHGIEPTLWKVEGLETVEATQQVADQAAIGGRTAQMIVLGRDAPADRLDHWLEVAAQVERFVGFAIGRSNWQDILEQQPDSGDTGAASGQIRQRYLGFTRHWKV